MIHVYVMMGLGGRLFSSGMENVLVRRLRKIPGVAVRPAFIHTQWREIVELIKRQPKGSKTVVIGHSMGAASATWVTDKVKVDLLVLYDLAGKVPSVLGPNTGRCIDIYDTAPDMVPESRVKALPGHTHKIERWTSYYGHSNQDDSVDLAERVAAEVASLKG